jgi:aryl-alcohol dehydrogenase-like predicted oxidoreductase
MSGQNKKYTRREFIQRSTAGAAIISSYGLLSFCEKTGGNDILPKRRLGKTELEVSLLSFGGGSQFLKNKNGEWEPLLEKAVNLGINHFDTASNYKWRAKMSSEERFGEILPQYRNKIFITTKFDTREPAAVRSEVETSLKKLNTDYIDILMIHSIGPSDDALTFEKGIYKELLSLKEEKIARFIGFSSMDSAQKSKELIEHLDFDTIMVALNPTKYGDFAELVLPAAQKKDIGIIAMKVMRDIVGKDVTPRELMNYGLSQKGVATANIAHFGSKTLEENTRLVKEFALESKSELKNAVLEKKLAHLAGPHALCWARPDYRDV